VSRVTKNIIYNGIGQGLSVILSFVAVRFVFRRLGGDALGLIYFSLAFSAALAVAVQLGVCESAVREIASHHKNRPDYIESFIRTSSLLYWTGYLVLALVAFIAAPYLVLHWVKLDSLDAVTATKIMRVLTVGALLALPTGLYKALLVGLQHMGHTNVIDVVAKALQQGGIFVILLVHGNLFHVAYWIAASMVIQVSVYWVVCSGFFPVRALLIPGFSRDVVKENMGYASGLMTITLCSWLLTETDKIIVSKLLPLALLGIYTFARGMVNQGMLLTGAINNAIFPHFSALYGTGKVAEMKSAYTRIQDLICFGTAPIFASVPFVALPIFSRIFNAHSAQVLLLPATFLCIGYYMNGTLVAPYVASLAVGRPDIAARQNLLALLIVPPASAVAIYWFGLSGAGFSWVVYHIFAYAYGLPRICRECLGISPRTWFWHVLRIMGAAILIYGCAWALIDWVGNFSIPVLATGYVVATIIFCIPAWGMMDETLRATILNFVTRGRVQPVTVAL